MTHNLDSRLEKLEALCPARERFVVRIIGDEDYAEQYAEAERQAKAEGKELFIIHRRLVSQQAGVE